MHSASQPINPLKRVRAGTPPTPTFTPSKAAPFDPTDVNADNSILSTDEVAEILLASDVQPLAKKLKCQLGRSLRPEGPSRMADYPSTVKTPIRTTSQCRDDLASHPV